MEIISSYFAEFTEQQQQQFEMLEPLYKEWNSKINVISRKDIDSLYEKHVLHSLAIAAVFDFEPGASIIDIGTGGGFPGIPLAIFFPEVQFHLVDSIGKKLKIVNAITEAAGIKNITTQHTRAEEIKNRQFDFAVSRAVAPLKELFTWARPLLKKPRPVKKDEEPKPLAPGLICLKGGDLAQEIQESGTRPRLMSVHDVFDLEFFKDKYILYIPR